MSEELTDYGRVRLMGDHLTDATALASALSMMSNSLDSDDGAAVSTVVALLHENLTKIEDLRVEVWRNLHPDRVKFEREGWPS